MATTWSELKGKPDFQEMGWFVRIYDQIRRGKTITEVCKLLKVHKTFLYRKIADLEMKLWPRGGEQLIDRASGRAWSTCPAGDSFYHVCRRLLSERDGALQEFHTDQRKLVVGTTHAILTFFLPRLLSESNFLGRHPEISLEVIQGEWNHLEDRLNSSHEQIDLGLGPCVPASARLVQSPPLRKICRGIAVPKRHSLWGRSAAEFQLRLLAREVVFYIRSDQEPGSAVERILPTPEAGGRRVRLPNYADIKAFVMAGLGVGVLYDRMVLPEDKQHLYWINASRELGSTTTHLYYPPGGRDSISEQARAFADMVITSTPQVFPDLK